MKYLDSLTKNISLGSVLIIFLSFLGQSLYYRQFNIDITNYVTISEFIILFLKISVIIILVFTLASPLMIKTKYIKLGTKKYSEMKIYQKRFILITLLMLVLILSGGVLVFYIMKETVSEIKNDVSNVTVFAFILGFVTLFLALITLHIFLKKNFSQITKLITAILFSVIFISSYSILSASQVKVKPPYYAYEIKKENETITTNNNLVRIGQTENYLFLYNKETETSIIIKTDDIKQISIHKTKKPI